MTTQINQVPSVCISVETTRKLKGGKGGEEDKEKKKYWENSQKKKEMKARRKILGKLKRKKKIE